MQNHDRCIYECKSWGADDDDTTNKQTRDEDNNDSASLRLVKE
jgi:hypothetical protein